MATLHHLQFAIDQKSIVRKASGGITIEGMASTDRLDRHGDVILPSAYEDTLETYMGNPQILLQHNYDKPIGQATDAQIKENGLWIKADVTEDEDGIIGKIEKGLFGAFSVGFFCLAYEYLYEGRVVFTQDGLVDGATWDEFYAADVRRITKVDLVEVSVVSVPANPGALFDVSKAARKAMALEAKSLIPKSVAESKAAESKDADEETPATVAEASEGKTESAEAEAAPAAAETSENTNEARQDDGKTTVSETAENAGDENSDEGEVQAGETPAAETVDAEKSAPAAESKAVAEEASEKATGDFISKSEHEATVKRLETALAEKDAAIGSLGKEIGEIYGTLAEIAKVSREAHKTALKAEKAFRLLPVNKGLASLGSDKKENNAADDGFFKALDSKVSEIRNGR